MCLPTTRGHTHAQTAQDPPGTRVTATPPTVVMLLTASIPATAPSDRPVLLGPPPMVNDTVLGEDDDPAPVPVPVPVP